MAWVPCRAWFAIADLNEAGGRAVAEMIRKNALAVRCDVSKPGDIAEAVAAVEAAFGTQHIVLNNAGWSSSNHPLMETDEQTIRKFYEIYVFSIFHMTKAMVPIWRRGGGGVMIDVGSVAGIRPRPGLNSSKGAANLMTKSLEVELAPDRIRVCGIAPVMGVTALLESFMGMPDTPENRARFIATIYVAAAAVYLASDGANFITGVILEVGRRLDDLANRLCCHEANPR